MSGLIPASWPLLSLLIWVPILGGFATLAFGERHPTAARWFALIVSLATLALCVPLVRGYDASSPLMQLVEQHAWVPAYKINYSLGVDGISIALIVLTALTTTLVIIGAWGSVQKRVSQYMAAFLVLEGLMLGVFCALDAMLFYVFFEAMLVPMFIIIGIWGGRDACTLPSSFSCTPFSVRSSC